MSCAIIKSMNRQYSEKIENIRVRRRHDRLKNVDSLSSVVLKFDKIIKYVLFGDDNDVIVAEEMPSREDMDMCTDKVLSKGRILQELTKAVKLVSKVFNKTSNIDIMLYM